MQKHAHAAHAHRHHHGVHGTFHHKNGSFPVFLATLYMPSAEMSMGEAAKKRKGFALFFVHRSNKSIRNGQDPLRESPQPHSAAVKMRSAHLTGRAFYGSIALIKGSNRRDPPRCLRQYGFGPQTTEIVRLLPEHRICSGKGLFFTSQTTCKEDILWHSFFQT